MQRWKRGRMVVVVLVVARALAAEGAAPDALPTGKSARPAAPPGQAEDPTSQRNRGEKLRFFRARLQESRLVFPEQPERPLELAEEPLSRFDNPVSGIVDGFTFLWTDRGRPAVLLKSYYNTQRGSWGRTYVSLATRPVEMSTQNQGKFWTPRDPGVTFAALENAPSPAAEPRTRLRQMRDLARQFEVIDHWGIKDPTDWQLRLLTSPLYRYEVPGEGVIDGAMFAYVLTTSPEALLLLEARKTAAGLEWSYAVSRSTRFAVAISRNGRKEAEFPRLEAWPPTGTYFHSPLPMPDYPFKPVAADASPP